MEEEGGERGGREERPVGQGAGRERDGAWGRGRIDGGAAVRGAEVERGRRGGRAGQGRAGQGRVGRGWAGLQAVHDARAPLTGEGEGSRARSGEREGATCVAGRKWEGRVCAGSRRRAKCNTAL